VTPAVSIAMDLRDALSYDTDSLARGCMLLKPSQRARLRQMLDLADSMDVPRAKETRMSLLSDLETAVDKVASEVETKVKEFDAAAVAEARRLVAEAKSAEQQAILLAGNYKAELEALAVKYGPELVKLGERLLADVKALFGVA
jgi:hypothetical protein